MNKYRDKSDFEINELVSFSLGYVHTKSFDPCNNPAYAMPIIIENKICMAYDVFAEEHDGGSWVAQPAYGFSDERVRGNNYYRAAMEVFLMMKEAENEKI